MFEKSKSSEKKNDFRTSMPEYSDEQIVTILKKRKFYQTEAADLAIQEALKRGLIHSEQDLFADEFNRESLPFSLFPAIADKKNKNNIRKSIARMFIICGVLPAGWGILRIFERKFFEGGILFLLGFLWIVVSTQFLKKSNAKLVAINAVLLGLSAVFIANLLLKVQSLVLLDYIIPAILFLFLIYGLLFLRRL